VRTARAEAAVALPPRDGLDLWTDVSRWPTFVEGFARVLEVAPEWPEPGAKVAWESIPSGRGRVTERVVAHGEGRFVTQVFEDALEGVQTLSFDEIPEGSRVEVRLEYDLSRPGPLRTLADVIFIRRALRDSLRRTLGRFRLEAEEQAGLR
jgi:uncharacterized membrane protein